MLTNLNSLPFENAVTLAEKIGVSEVTIGRFCRKLGYKHFKDLKTELGESIGHQPWLVGDRLKEFTQESSKGNASAKILEKKLQHLFIFMNSHASHNGEEPLTVLLRLKRSLLLVSRQSAASHNILHISCNICAMIYFLLMPPAVTSPRFS